MSSNRSHVIGSAIFSLVTISSQVFAESTETNFSGSARLRYEDSYAKDPTGADRVAFTSLRIRPNILVKVNSELSLVLEPQFAKILGAQVMQPSTATANVGTDTSGNSTYAGDSFTVFQAYLDMKLEENLNFIGGRQVLKYGDELILGPGDWGVTGRSFDALKLRYTNEKAFIDIFDAKIVENTSANSRAGGDKDLYGIYASWNISETIKAFDVYYFYLYDARDPVLATPADNGRPAYFSVYGTRWMTAFDNVSWKFEFAQNSGAEGTTYVATNENSKNSMLDTEVGLIVDDSLKTKLSLEIFRGDANLRELYPTTAKQLGRTDVVGRRNLTGLGLHYSAGFTDKLILDADAYVYQRTSKDNPSYGTDSKTAVGTVASSTSLDIGNEVDLIGKYASSKNLTWSLGLNFFLPGQYIKDNQGSDSGRVTDYGFFMAETKF